MPLARERPSYHPQANPAHPYATDKVDWEGVLVAVKLFAIAGILIGLVGVGHGHSFASLWPLWTVGGLAIVAIFYTLLPGYPYSAPTILKSPREEAYTSACYAARKRLEEPVYRWAETAKVGGDDLSRARLVEMVLQHTGEERTYALKAKLTSLVVGDALDAEDPDAPAELGKHLLECSYWCADAIWKGRHRALTPLGTLIETCGSYLKERPHDRTTKPSEVIETLLLQHDGPVNVGVGGALGLIADAAEFDAAIQEHAAYIFPALAPSPAQVANEAVNAAAEVIGESHVRALRGSTVTEWLTGREEAKLRRKQSDAHAVALADWTERLAPTFSAEYELDLTARTALLTHETETEIGDLIDGLDLSQAEQREILTRYFVCEALGEKLGLSQGLKRVLSTDAFMRKVGDLSWAPRRNLPQKLAATLPGPLPWGVETGSKANVAVCEANQKLLRILEFAIRYVREVDKHDDEPIAAVAAIAGHREHADRRYGDPSDPAAARMWEIDAAWWAERASQVRIADTMEEIVNERAPDFHAQTEQTTVRAQLVSLCAHEQAAAQLHEEARLAVAAAGNSPATKPATRAAKLAQSIDAKIGSLIDAVAGSRKKQVAALTRYVVCRDLAKRLGFSQAHERLLYANALLGEDPAGLPAFRRDDLPRKLRKLLPKPIPLEKSKPGTELAFKLSIQSQRLFRVVVLASAFCEALKGETADSDAAAAVCSAQRAHAEGYDARLRATAADETRQRQRLTTHQAFELELADTMQKVVAERSVSFLEEAKQMTFRGQLVALCAEEQAAAELSEELSFPVATERDSTAKVPVTSNGHQSAQPAKDAKAERGKSRVGRPGLALGLGIASCAAMIPGLAVLAPASRWQPVVLLVALVGLAAIVKLAGIVATGRAHLIDPSFVVALLALVLLGPLPAVAIWVAAETAEWLVERYRVEALLANVASEGWGVFGAAFVFAALVSEQAVTELSGTASYLWVGAAGLLMLALNYFTSRPVTLVRDGDGWLSAMKREFIGTLPAAITMTALGLVTVLLYGYIGISALAVFVAIVPVPQVLIPTAYKQPRVAARLNASALGRLTIRTAQLAGFLPAEQKT